MNKRISLRAADEKTEVFLTDYLDGTLSPERRADLDAYLAANPGQRLILQELIEQRGGLKSLPSESAPAEIYDTVAAQLERLALVHDAVAMPMPPRRRALPHLAAIAATLLLAAGLATALYFVLAPQTPPFTLATSNLAPATDGAVADRRLRQTEAAGEAVAPAAPPTSPTVAAPAASAQRRLPAAAAAPQPLSAADGPAVAAPSVTGVTPHPFPEGMALSQRYELRSPSGFGAAPATLLDESQVRRDEIARLMALRSADPVATRGRVTRLLRDGGWSFTEVEVAALPTSLAWAWPTAGPVVRMPPLRLPPSEVAGLIVRVEPEQVDALLAALSQLAPATSPGPATPVRPTAGETRLLARDIAGPTVRILLHFPTGP